MATAQRRPRRSLKKSGKMLPLEATKALDAELSRYAAQQLTLEEDAKALAKTEETIEMLMRNNKRERHEASGWAAVIADVKSRTSTVVNAEGLYDLMTKNGTVKDFFNAVKVSVTESKKIATAKELAKISTVTPAAVTGTKITIKPVKIKISK